MIDPSVKAARQESAARHIREVVERIIAAAEQRGAPFEAWPPEDLVAEFRRITRAYLRAGDEST